MSEENKVEGEEVVSTEGVDTAEAGADETVETEVKAEGEAEGEGEQAA